MARVLHQWGRWPDGDGTTWDMEHPGAVATRYIGQFMVRVFKWRDEPWCVHVGVKGVAHTESAVVALLIWDCADEAEARSLYENDAILLLPRE